MRRLEFLITQVRNSTDNKDVNGVATEEIVGYFNDAQRYIATLIFKNNPYADLFKTQVVIPAISTGIYSLPSNCWAVNAISMIEGRFNVTQNNEGFTRIRPISESEMSYMFGYVTRNNQILISGQNSAVEMMDLRITYFRKLPTLDIRQAKVLAITPGVSILLDGSPDPLYTMDDHCSLSDSQGIQEVSNVYFTNTAGSLLLTADTLGVTVGQHVTAGSDSANSSLLPEACETYLLDYVKQRIYTRNNYEDTNKQVYFTEQQKAEVISIFSKNKKDDDTIPITDIEFLTF